MITVEELRGATDSEKRNLLGKMCIWHRHVISKVYRGLINLPDIEQACAQNCGHHECRKNSLTQYLEENHFRSVNEHII